jgi:hypothetical protein
MMSDFVVDRVKITEKVLSLLDSNISLDRALAQWWRNIRKNGGLSLTSQGDEAFRMAQLEYWDKKLADERNYSELQLYLKLDKKMKCPYILFRKGKNHILRVYDSRIAVSILLWNEIDDFLDSTQVRKNIQY